MDYMPTLTPLAPPQLIGIYGSPISRLMGTAHRAVPGNSDSPRRVRLPGPRIQPMTSRVCSLRVQTDLKDFSRFRSGSSMDPVIKPAGGRGRSAPLTPRVADDEGRTSRGDCSAERGEEKWRCGGRSCLGNRMTCGRK